MASTYIELAPVVQTTIVGSVEIVNDVGNPIPVNAIDLDIRDLTFAADKVDASGSEVSLDAATLAALENITVSGSVSTLPPTTTTGTPVAFVVSTFAVLLAASNINRKSIVVTNNTTGQLYIGHTPGVTTSGATMGLIVQAYGCYTDSGDGLYTGDLYGIYSTTAATQNVSVSERT